MEPTLGFNRIRISVSEHTGYLRFKVDGVYDFDDVYRGLNFLLEAMVKWKSTHALVDVRDVEGVIPDSDRHILAVHFAQTWGSEPRTAVVERQQRINHFFENTAIDWQARTRVFPEERPALEWLLST